MLLRSWWSSKAVPSSAALLCVLSCALLSLQTSATFTDGFQSFLSQQYGAQVAKQLTREDLGVNGSFGGNVSPSLIRIFRDPVVMVHGLNNNAGSLLSIRDFFYHQGYGVGEIYATSYGPNGTIVDASSPLLCAYVKQIRQLITAVSAYTAGKRVVVVGYSLGVPIARKAILGGQCLDTGENLGQPLSKQIAIFLSVAGANQGAVECNSFPDVPLCNAKNGFKSGSQYLKDINSQKGYEGQSRYAIASKTDDVVGYANLSLPSSQINVTLNNFTHGDTCLNTVNIQYSLISKGFATQFSVNKDAYAESKLTSSNCSGQINGGDSFQYGPHDSKQLQARRGGGGDNQFENDDEYHGEYNRQAKVFTFLNGFNYTHHTNPSRGSFFKVKGQQPSNNRG